MDPRDDWPNIEKRPDVEASWSHLYVYLHQRLRAYQPFHTWLDALLAGAEGKPGLQQLRRWPQGSLGHDLLTASPPESIGLILAVALPSRGTFRFAFPVPQALPRYLSLLGHQDDTATTVPEQDVLRHILMQMNFSCGEPWGVLNEHGAAVPIVRESMMWAAFVSNRAVYCRDVFELDTHGTTYVVPGTDVHFRSVDEEAQRSWRMSTVVYVPCRYADDDGRPQGFTLALSSPLADLFPGFLELENVRVSMGGGEHLLAATPPPEWAEAITREIVPYAWYRALVQQDEVARYAAHGALSSIDDLFLQKLDGAPAMLRGLLSSQLPTLPTSQVEAIVEHLSEYLLDSHVQNLQVVLRAYPELGRASDKSIDSELVKDILRYAAILNDEPRSGGKLAFAGMNEVLSTLTQCPLDRLRERLSAHSLGHWTAIFLNALITNALAYGTLSSGPAEVTCETVGREVRFAVSNPVPFDLRLLDRYWTVRESILPVERRSDSSGHGVQLFLLRHLPHEAGLRVDFRLDPPSAPHERGTAAIGTWRSILRVRFGEGS